ncbi:MAG: maleylpyruvate isomerase family mycothiol-dependent enzyme [Propionicimonas sp.]
MDFLDAITTESERFLAAIARTDPGDRVPTCPDWSADDLLWHLTEVHGYWAEILRTGARTEADAQAVEAAAAARPGTRTELIELFTRHTAALVAELERRDDAEPAWFWLESAQRVGSTRRMQAHEALMHRIDAEAAAGIASAGFDPALAADGVAHAFDVMWAWWGTLPGFELVEVGGPVELVASDLDSSWLAQPGRWRGTGESGRRYDQPGAVLAAAGQPVARITGTAEELDRWLWGRGAEPEASGDLPSLDALRAAQAEGMQ